MSSAILLVNFFLLFTTNMSSKTSSKPIYIDPTTQQLFPPICKAGPNKLFYTVYTEKLQVTNLFLQMYRKYLPNVVNSKLKAARESMMLILEAAPLTHIVPVKTGLRIICHASTSLQCSGFFLSA